MTNWLLNCTIMPRQVELVARMCKWCGRPVPPRNTSWCSQRCVDAYLVNHDWSQARPTRLRLDGYTCQTCGAEGYLRLGRWVDGVKLEVNHLVPVLGNRTAGCHHHLTNLITLCHRCHVSVTNGQRARGELARA